MDTGVAVATHIPIKDMLLVRYGDVLSISTEPSLLVEFSAYAGASVCTLWATEMTSPRSAESGSFRVARRASEHILNGAGH